MFIFSSIFFTLLLSVLLTSFASCFPHVCCVLILSGTDSDLDLSVFFLFFFYWCDCFASRGSQRSLDIIGIFPGLIASWFPIVIFHLNLKIFNEKQIIEIQMNQLNISPSVLKKKKSRIFVINSIYEYLLLLNFLFTRDSDCFYYK